MDRRTRTEDGTAAETLSNEIIGQALEDMARAVYEIEIQKQKGE